jgi:hypothetical protein
MHDFFHVSILRHSLLDPSHAIDFINKQVLDEWALKVE